jgi:hypothetical protein
MNQIFLPSDIMNQPWVIALVVVLVLFVPIMFFGYIFINTDNSNSKMLGYSMIAVNVLLVFITGGMSFINI